jgi:hypothetical protein
MNTGQTQEIKARDGVELLFHSTCTSVTFLRDFQASVSQIVCTSTLLTLRILHHFEYKSISTHLTSEARR